jgi:hypothetical protein
LQHAFEDFLSRLKRVSADKPDDNTGEICRLGFYKAAAKLVAVGAAAVPGRRGPQNPRKPPLLMKALAAIAFAPALAIFARQRDGRLEGRKSLENLGLRRRDFVHICFRPGNRSRDSQWDGHDHAVYALRDNLCYRVFFGYPAAAEEGEAT